MNTSIRRWGSFKIAFDDVTLGLLLVVGGISKSRGRLRSLTLLLGKPAAESVSLNLNDSVGKGDSEENRYDISNT